MGRMQSPSSINMYRQCPRKYYYRYIEKLPTKPSIHLVRGTIAHEVLEHFFDEIIFTDDWRLDLQKRIFKLFKDSWSSHSQELKALELTDDELLMYKEETMRMFVNYLDHFISRMEKLVDSGKTPIKAFDYLKPRREVEYRDEELNIRGFIDCIEEYKDKVHLIDYKTSKKPEITSDYKLQLGIYALLYLREHNRLPDGVGIHFLRHNKQIIKVNDELLLEAQFQIEQIHMLTQTTAISHYPKKPSPLCNWCDYYDKCYGKKA